MVSVCCGPKGHHYKYAVDGISVPTAKVPPHERIRWHSCIYYGPTCMHQGTVGVSCLILHAAISEKNEVGYILVRWWILLDLITGNTFCNNGCVFWNISFTDAFHRTKEVFGQLDILCNNAGIMHEGKWQHMLDVNLVNNIII